MKLMLIRHALPHHISTPGKLADPNLTPEGQRQAENLADYLKTSPYGTVTSLVSSTMTRAIETARPLESALSLPLSTDSRLVEVDSTWTSYGVGLKDYPSRRAAWDDMNRGRLGDNVFDPKVFSQTVVDGIEDRISAEKDDDGITAIVCHGGVISAYLAHMVGSTRMFFVDCAYTSITMINAERDGYREILSVNESQHLLP